MGQRRCLRPHAQHPRATIVGCSHGLLPRTGLVCRERCKSARRPHETPLPCSKQLSYSTAVCRGKVGGRAVLFVQDSLQGSPTANRHQPPTANRQPPSTTNRQPPSNINRCQPPTTVQYCFCGSVSCPSLTLRYEPFFSFQDRPGVWDGGLGGCSTSLLTIFVVGVVSRPPSPAQDRTECSTAFFLAVKRPVPKWSHTGTRAMQRPKGTLRRALVRSCCPICTSWHEGRLAYTASAGPCCTPMQAVGL